LTTVYPDRIVGGTKSQTVYSEIRRILDQLFRLDLRNVENEKSEQLITTTAATTTNTNSNKLTNTGGRQKTDNILKRVNSKAIPSICLTA
jgi:hypothetical protein